MKKLLISAVALVMTLSASALDIFNHLGAGVGVGTTGISVELATPITKFVTMRAGVSIMPGITFNSDVDYSYSRMGQDISNTTSLKGDLGRTQGQVIFNVYPAPAVPFYVAVGGYFGGDKLVKITGNVPELATEEGKVVIGNYEIPAGPNGEVSGGIKVKSFRPYFGLGFGRAIPKRLINFNLELGVQVHGTPKLYTDYGTIDETIEEDDNTFNKIKDKLTVYPTLTFRLGFKAF